jgi:hypothetical protein
MVAIISIEQTISVMPGQCKRYRLGVQNFEPLPNILDLGSCYYIHLTNDIGNAGGNAGDTVLGVQNFEPLPNILTCTVAIISIEQTISVMPGAMQAIPF